MDAALDQRAHLLGVRLAQRIEVEIPKRSIVHVGRDRERLVGRADRTGDEARAIGLSAFAPAFEAECAAAGFAIDARKLMERMAAASQPRPTMLAAIRTLRASGLRVAALTNNWPSEERDDGTRALRHHFDAFFESSALGMQKPDPRIYQHACAALAISPEEAVFLDDIGRNLKAARALGMTTIKVDTPEQALGELADLLIPSGILLNQDIEIG